MMQAFTSVANNGTMLKPQFISKIVDGNTGEETVTQPEEVGIPSQKKRQQKYGNICVMLSKVKITEVLMVSMNYRATIFPQNGTAQVADPTTGKYLSGGTNYLYSVVLMFPSEEPEYILYLTIKLPEKHESTVLGEIANPLMKRVMDQKFCIRR